MKKIFILLGSMTLIATTSLTVISCSTADARIRQSFVNWTYTAKTDEPIYGKVFDNDKNPDSKLLSYWFITQFLISSLTASTNKTWYQLISTQNGLSEPNTSNLESINPSWFATTIEKTQAGLISENDLTLMFLYLSIYVPIMTSKDTSILKYSYSKKDNLIKIDYKVQTPTEIEEYKTTTNQKYDNYYQTILTNKYPDLVPYFYDLPSAHQKINLLIDNLIRVLVIMTPHFSIGVNIIYTVLPI